MLNEFAADHSDLVFDSSDQTIKENDSDIAIVDDDQASLENDSVAKTEEESGSDAPAKKKTSR